MSQSSSPYLRAAVIVGVRPQYIKAAALSQIISVHNDFDERKIELCFVDTAQHFSSELIPSGLGVNEVKFSTRFAHGSTDAFQIFTDSLHLLGTWLREQPQAAQCLITIGDANPAAIGAIAGAKLNIPVVHIEAGARRDPTEQEEKNRRIADQLSVLRLCITERAVSVLETEGLSDRNVWTGDLWRDYLLKFALQFEQCHVPDSDRPVLVTIHRPQNLQKATIQAICAALDHTGRPVHWSMHPRAHDLVTTSCPRSSHFNLLGSLSYGGMVAAMMQSAYVLTDSGGLIREAHHLQRHVLVRRDYGGWDELVTLGVNRRIGDDANDIRAAMSWAEEVRQRPYPTESPLVRSNGVQFGIEALLALGGGPI